MIQKADLKRFAPESQIVIWRYFPPTKMVVLCQFPIHPNSPWANPISESLQAMHGNKHWIFWIPCRTSVCCRDFECVSLSVGICWHKCCVFVVFLFFYLCYAVVFCGFVGMCFVVFCVCVCQTLYLREFSYCFADWHSNKKFCMPNSKQGAAGSSQFCCQRRQLWILREADWDVNLCTCFLNKFP